MANQKLGIYFGRNRINLVESCGTKVLNSIFVPADILADRSKAIEAIQGAIKDNKIKARKAVIGLANNDQFIRGFKMLMLNKEELEAGVSFEAKKYIPFKTEELISDYQRRVNKKTVKMDIFYVAAIKGVLEGIIESLTRSGLQIIAIEPAIFSLFRLLVMTKQFDLKSSLAILCVNNAEVEFAVIDKGFPCFSRDMRLSETSEGIALAIGSQTMARGPIDAQGAAFLSKLSSEIRVSLAYFRRQFSSEGSSVNKMLLFSKDISGQEELISELKESLNLPIEKVRLENLKDIHDKIGDIDLLKAYALTLSDRVKINLTIDLAKRSSLHAVSPEKAAEEKPAALNYKNLQKPIALALAVAAAAYGLPQDQITKAKQRLNVLRMDTASAMPERLKNASIDALKQERQNYSYKIAEIENLVKSCLKIFPVCAYLPKAMDKGIWLTDFTFTMKDGRRLLTIKGMVYLEDQDAEIAAVNQFLDRLRDNQDFTRGFRALGLKSVSRGLVEEYNLTQFEITEG